MAAAGEFKALPNRPARPVPGERLESVFMEVSEVSDARAVLSVDGSVLSSSSFKESDNLDSDPAVYEKFLLDMDSYWDDLGARLTVSRMVSDSVIKGMVNAVVTDAAEKIASKEAELRITHDRLQSYESNSGKFSLLSLPDHLMMKIESQNQNSELQYGFSDANVEHGYIENLGKLKIAIEEQLQRLTDDLKNARISNSSCRVNGYSSDVGLTSTLHQGNPAKEFLKIEKSVDALKITLSITFKQISHMLFSFKASMCEHQWEDEFQREVNTIMIQSYIKDLHNEFEVKLWEQKGLINNLNKNWQKRVNELSTMRQELDAISKSVCNSEQWLQLSHSSHDFEEWTNGKRKEHVSQKVSGNHHLLSPCYPEESGTVMAETSIDSPKPMSEVAESSQLKLMTKEEAISYYKSEMTKMRRQHDLALQNKTEELFILKREFLKEKGSSPFKKDKEFEHLRKKIPEVILKLDDILLDSEKLPVVHDNHEELCGLKDKIDALFFKNQHLRSLLTDKRKEVMHLSSQVSDAANQISLHSSVESRFLKQIEKLKWRMEDLMIETSIRDDLCKDMSRDFVDKHKSIMEDLEIHTYILQEVLSIIYRGVTYDAMANINPVILKSYAEQASFQAVLMEKEKALCLEIEEKEKLKHDITLLVEEKENFASEAGSTLIQQKEQFDLVWQEINMLRDKVSKQEILISEKNMEFDSVSGRLDETLQQINKYAADINSLNQRNRILWESLDEAEKENDMLHGIIEENKNSLSSSVTKEKEQGKRMESIVISVSGLSKAVVDFENRLEEIVGHRELRLKELSNQCNQLLQHANLLRKKGSLYKDILEIKCSNLQKAETEVDLLGDEVDGLLSLLGKVYIALDHYSPVLKHYPGVMEILKLVQRELKGENNELI